MTYLEIRGENSEQITSWMVKPKALFSPRPVFEYSRFAGLITAKRLLLFSSIASFVWKPAQFEFRSGAWHNASIAFVKEYTAIFFFISEIEVHSDKHRHNTVRIKRHKAI